MRRILAVLLLLGLTVTPARAAENPKYVALTFDDGPSGKYTQTLLEGLRQRYVPATFFLCGYRMRQYPELTQKIHQEGHEIGLHGYSHDNMLDMSRRTIAQEIAGCQALLPEGCETVFLRPPGGCCSDGVRQVAEARGLAIVSWSVDPRDWALTSAWQIEKAVVEAVADGDIILLHDMSDSSVKAALRIVDALQRRGYRFVTVSDLAKLRGVSLKSGQVYRKFPPEAQPMK